MDNFVQTIQKWFSQPLDTQGNAGQWFLFLGLVIVAIFAWSRIIRFITEE